MAWERFKHAFSVGHREAKPLSEVQERLLDRFCTMIQQRKMTPAAVAFLELSRPLNYVGAQGLYFLEPFATAIFSREEYREFARFLERRDAVDRICERLQPTPIRNGSGEPTADSLRSGETHSEGDSHE